MRAGCSHVGATPGGMQGGRRGFAWPQPGPVSPSSPVGGLRVWGLLEGERKPDFPGSLSGQGSGKGRRKRRGARSPWAALSALLALAGCSGFLRCSLGHYARLAGLRLAARGAGGLWDAGTAAGSSPLPPLLSGLVKKQNTCLRAWKTEAWVTVLFKSTAWPPTGQPPRCRVTRRCTQGDKRRRGQRTSLPAVLAMHGQQARGGVIEGG